MTIQDLVDENIFEMISDLLYMLKYIRQAFKIGNIPVSVCILTERVDAEPQNILPLA